MRPLAITTLALLLIALTACQAPKPQPEGITVTIPIPRLDYVQESTNGPTFAPLEGY